MTEQQSGGKPQSNSNRRSSGGQRSSDGHRRSGGQRSSEGQHRSSGQRRTGGGQRSSGQRHSPKQARNPRRRHQDQGAVPQKREISGKVPELGQNTLRVIPLGGFEEVGRNMMVIEYGNDQIVVDVGLSFSTEQTPGIDFVIPNVDYLKNSTKKMHAVLLTHGHYDHMGALPFVMRDIGNPQVYATPLTRAMIQRRQEEYVGAPKLEIHIIDKSKNDTFTFGPFKISYFHVNHNIPDSVGFVIDTPVGRLVHTGDFKFDYTPIGDMPADLQSIAKIGSEGVLALLSDSTGAERPGHSLSETTIYKTLDGIFRDTKGRIIISTFASLIGRHQQIYNLAEKYGRRVAIVGYSMKTNFEITNQLGLIKVTKKILMPLPQADKSDPSKTIVLCTGAQGEAGAALSRIANRENKNVTLRRDDTVIFSSSVIPGNERSVQTLKDQLLKQGAHVIHYRMLDVHAGGHGQAEDLKLMINLIKPKFLIPIHGQHSMLREHGEIGKTMGMGERDIAVGYNGAFIDFDRQHIVVKDGNIATNPVFVDGLGVGDVREVVMRDRQALAEDGMFVIVTVINRKTGRVHGEPDIISRGFIYLRESMHLIAGARKRVKMIVEQSARAKPIDEAHVRDAIKDDLGQYFFDKTQRRPMVLPIIIEV